MTYADCIAANEVLFLDARIQDIWRTVQELDRTPIWQRRVSLVSSRYCQVSV